MSSFYCFIVTFHFTAAQQPEWFPFIFSWLQCEPSVPGCGTGTCSCHGAELGHLQCPVGARAGGSQGTVPSPGTALCHSCCGSQGGAAALTSAWLYLWEVSQPSDPLLSHLGLNLSYLPWHPQSLPLPRRDVAKELACSVLFSLVVFPAFCLTLLAKSTLWWLAN